MSRPRPFAVGQFGVATWSFEVATWGRLSGCVATNALSAGVRPVGRARSSSHDLGTARAVCARPGFWVCAVCTQPSFVTVHYFRVTVWTLFTGFKKKVQNF